MGVGVATVLCLALVAFSVGSSLAAQADAALAAITAVAALGPDVTTPDARSFGIALDPVARRLYVANNRSTSLSIVDAAANVVLATVALDAAPNQVAVNPLTGRVYVSSFDARSTTIIDGRSASVLSTLPVGGLGLALNTQGTHVIAAAGGHIAVIDAVTGDFAELEAPAGANLWGVAAGAGSLAYLTDLFTPRVLIFDVEQARFVGEIAIDAPGRFGITASLDGSRLYVASYVAEGARLSVIDTAGRRVIASVPVGGLPFGVALDEAGATAYVTSFAADSVTAVDTSRGSVRATLASGRAPAGVVFDPVSGRLFVATAAQAAEVRP
jgi:YVTN family beta-propeller protein